MTKPRTPSAHLSPSARSDLAQALHLHREADDGFCDHGTYSGGPSDGEPYAMCDRAFGENSSLSTALAQIIVDRASLGVVSVPNSSRTPGNGSGLLDQGAVLTDEEESVLVDALHHRNEFEYSECDHEAALDHNAEDGPVAECQRAVAPGSRLLSSIGGLLAAPLELSLGDVGSTTA